MTIIKYGHEEAKTIITKGYPITTNDSTIYFINSGHLPNILKAEIPADKLMPLAGLAVNQVPRIKQIRKTGFYGILIGVAVGFGVAAILDANWMSWNKELNQKI